MRRESSGVQSSSPFLSCSPRPGARRNGPLGNWGFNRSWGQLGFSWNTAGLHAAGLLLAVVSIRRLCAANFHRSAGIAASGGLASIIAAIAMSVARAREAKNVVTYGSARWARLAKCAPPASSGQDGVVLGRSERDYLRHDGPEHVLCFAPTRSARASASSSRRC